MLLVLVHTAQAKNGDNTKAATGSGGDAGAYERGERRGNGDGGCRRRREADTTLDISYPSARNPLTS